MSATYQVWLDDARGNQVADLSSLLGMTVALGENTAAWSMALPETFDRRQIGRDALVEVWRKPEAGAARLLLCGMVKRVRQERDETGVETLMIGGLDGRALLSTRIIAYPAGSSQATKTGAVDDLMKAVVRENLGSLATDTARDLSGYGISVAEDLGLGPTVPKVIGWKNLLTVLKDFSAASREMETDCFFDMVPTALAGGLMGWTFVTAIGQPGLDRSAEVRFGEVWGNMSNPVLEEDWTDEASTVYAGGRGLVVSNQERLDSSIWGRREVYLDTKAETDTAVMTAMANEELSYRGEKKTFTARLYDSGLTRFGIEWGFGDRVSCEAFGQDFSGVIKTLSIKLDESGETLDARIQIDG